MIDSFKFHCSDYGEAVLGMSDEQIGALFRSLVEYAMEGDKTPVTDPLVSALSNIMVKHIDRDEAYRKKQSENGKKGGGQFGNTNAKRAKTSQNEPKTSENNPKTSQNKLLSYPILSNNNNICVSKKKNSFVDDCPKSEIDFDDIEKKIVKN